MPSKVAVVTGANKGIGFAIVRALCKQYDGDVILTARNVDLGKAAQSKLGEEGLKPKFHQLDINSKESMNIFAKYLTEAYGGVDVLVNNAGVAFKFNATEPFHEQAEISISTNYHGTLNLCDCLFPLLRPHARVVNLSSGESTRHLSYCSEANRRRITDQHLTMDTLTNILQEFISAAKNNRVKEDGWSNSAYGLSKIGVTAMSIIQQKQFDSDPREDIIVNAADPGYVATDMSSYRGHLTIDEGAETPVYLALLPPGCKDPRGKLVYKKQVQPWKV